MNISTDMQLRIEWLQGLIQTMKCHPAYFKCPDDAKWLGELEAELASLIHKRNQMDDTLNPWLVWNAWHPVPLEGGKWLWAWPWRRVLIQRRLLEPLPLDGIVMVEAGFAAAPVWDYRCIPWDCTTGERML